MLLSGYLQTECFLQARLSVRSCGVAVKSSKPRPSRACKDVAGLLALCRSTRCTLLCTVVQSTLPSLLCHPLRTAAGGEDLLSPPAWLGAQHLLTAPALQGITFITAHVALRNIKPPLDKKAPFDV